MSTMEGQSQQANPNGAWVRLYLVPQTESTEMPTYIEGYLTEETPNSYVLTRMIEYVENEDFEIEAIEVVKINLISRVYVWRCEILNEKPGGSEEESYNGVGGLG